jgi:hypothetical protein
MIVDLNNEDCRYLVLLVKNRYNDMVFAEESDEMAGRPVKEVRSQELDLATRLLAILDPEDNAVFGKDYPYLRDP